MPKPNLLIASVIILIVGLVAGAIVMNKQPISTQQGGDFFVDPTEPPPNDEDEKICSMEVKLCPDGSYVGRAGPNCAFARCPADTSPEYLFRACKTDTDCSAGYYCTDVSPVVREGYQNLRCWKKGMPTPICLSGNTRIATPEGEIAVKNLIEEMIVWTVDSNGRKIAAPILKTGKTEAPKNHHVIHIILADGRELFISPGHTLGDGRLAGEIRAGTMIENTIITMAELVPYTENATYDILPAGETGMYWGEGILLRSTLNQ